MYTHICDGVCGKEKYFYKKKNIEKEKKRIAVTKEFRNLNGIWIWNGCWCGGISNRGEKNINGICGLKLIGFLWILTYHFILCIMWRQFRCCAFIFIKIILPNSWFFLHHPMLLYKEDKNRGFYLKLLDWHLNWWNLNLLKSQRGKQHDGEFIPFFFQFFINILVANDGK